MKSPRKIAILQSNYIPWKGYFDLISSVDTFVIYDEVQYTKNDWRNRNLIKTKSGLQWLTIPVRQLSLNQKISETRITLRNWNIKHWTALNTNYAKATHFQGVRDFVSDLYLGESMSDLLSEVNIRFITRICRFLGINTQIVHSSELHLQGDRNERLVDACKKLKGDVYLSGPAAQGYLDIQLFETENIKVEWMNYSGYSEYNQMFPPFQHSVSILDVIFNTGLLAPAYIKKTSK